MQILDLIVDIVEWNVPSVPVVDGHRSIGGRLRYGVVRMRTDMVSKRPGSSDRSTVNWHLAWYSSPM